MLNWLRAWRDSIRELWKPDPVTEEMVYTVVPTIWIRKMKVRERLVGHYPELTDLEISDARIYICLRRLEVLGRIECDVRRYPKMHYDVGICRKIGPRRPSAKIEAELHPAYA